jgi:hypothetical protein
MKFLVSVVWLIFFTAFGFAGENGMVPIKQLIGDYQFGDGLGVNCSLNLSTNGKFKFEWHGCLGLYDKNQGTYILTNGILNLVTEKRNIREGFQGTPTNFFPIPWGNRLYIIPTNEIIKFCSDVNQGLEPRDLSRGSFYLKTGEWTNTVSGLPNVPVNWKPYLLAKPVNGKITQLITKEEAWLNLGSKDGILAEMEMFALEFEKTSPSCVKIISVEKNRCRIRSEWDDSELAVGQEVTSHYFGN